MDLKPQSMRYGPKSFAALVPKMSGGSVDAKEEMDEDEYIWAVGPAEGESFLPKLLFNGKCSGCGTFGSAVASAARGPEFKSPHWQLLLNNYLQLTVCKKAQLEIY